MAIPLAAVIQLILDRTLLQKEPEVEGPIGGRDKLNLLRYEIQELLGGIRNQARQTQPGDTNSRTRIDTAMEEMEKLAAQLPQGFGIEWTGQSLQEKQSGAEAPILMALLESRMAPIIFS